MKKIGIICFTEKTMENICEWSKADVAGYDIGSITEKQIDEFLRDMTWKL